MYGKEPKLLERDFFRFYGWRYFFKCLLEIQLVKFSRSENGCDFVGSHTYQDKYFGLN